VRALSTSDVLDLWERGAGMHPLDRGLLTLATVKPEVSPADIADWPLGRRNHALLEMQIAAFGPKLQGWCTCLGCDEKMEFEIDAHALAAEHRSSAAGEIHFKSRTFRLPTSRDLSTVGAEGDSNAAALMLVRRCLSEGDSLNEWGPQDTESLGEAMAAADPLAEVRISLACPRCENEQEETIDLVNFLWSELEARAKRAFWEVHTIASAYGWTEREILALSPVRRAHYTEMVQA